MTEYELAATVGTRLPGGTALVEPYVDWLWRDAVGAPAGTDGTAHPTVAFLAAQGGVGLELEEVFALFGSSSAEGPVLGEWSVEFARPLRIGEPYGVAAVVESAVRKRGARTGVFDIATLRIELTAPDGAVHVTVRSSIVYPRRDA